MGGEAAKAYQAARDREVGKGEWREGGRRERGGKEGMGEGGRETESEGGRRDTEEDIRKRG